MIKITLILVALIKCATVYSQNNFIERQILGNGIEEPVQLSVDVYPFLFLSNGGGGSLGIEFNHWHIGLIGFSVIPPEFIKTTFFQNADDITIKRNNAIELFANYYLRKDRKGLYAGVMGGPESFIMEDNLSGESEKLIKTYIVPKSGIRVFPFKKYFYIDASAGWSFNISGTEQRVLGQSTYNASKGGFIYFLQVGSRFNL